MTLPASDLKVLAFDVFGTVVDWRNGIAEAVKVAAIKDLGFFQRLEQDVVKRQSKRDFVVEKFSHARL